MGDYIRCLHHILDRHFDIIRPTHGPAITDVQTFVQAYIDHRLEREKQICTALENGLSKIGDMVPLLYADIDKRLHPAAAHSVLAHLIYLWEQGRVKVDGQPTLKSVYALT